MKNIQAIGFDLFNTLITAEPITLKIAIERLIDNLRVSGYEIDEGVFKKTYGEVVLSFVEEAKRSGLETHNRFWISATLKRCGYELSPDDPRTMEALNRYFSAFYSRCHPIPGTIEMLEKLKGKYRLGLLSNFTHGPAAREILERTGLAGHFETILISGEIGYRKPHRKVFERLSEELGVTREKIMYIGDDPEPDIHGAKGAGLQPLWMTHVRDKKIPMAPGMIHSDTDQPEFEVPTITDWQGLYRFLGIE